MVRPPKAQDASVRRGLAKRATTVRQRAELRAQMPTEEERIKFDRKCAKSDFFTAKRGDSKTLLREFAARGIDVMAPRLESKKRTVPCSWTQTCPERANPTGHL